MEFVLFCIDKADSAGVRFARRGAHLRYAQAHYSAFRFGGPLMDEQGRPAGILMILDLPNRAALDAHMAGDPFFGGDLFESVTVWATRQVLPEREPGALAREVDAASQVPTIAPLQLRSGPAVLLRVDGESVF